MYSGLLIILLPLIVGYLVPLRAKKALRSINRLQCWMVYVILFLMGISLAFLENLGSNLLLIFRYVAVFFACIIAANAVALWLWGKHDVWVGKLRQEAPPSRLHMLLDSLTLCLVVFGGFVLGLSQWPGLAYASQGSEYALILLLFFVGVQLRNSGMTLRQIVLNRRGAAVALVIGSSALVGGLIAAWVLGLPLTTGLAMASGYGWYSLSGILLTDAFGPVIGSAAFFNDLARELLAITLIPTLAQRNLAYALGLCGATSMDFTLPVLQRSAGVEMVPAAIVHGFLLSLATPILMAVFLS
ncbi:lysine exporter LysO family protein [Brenneria rubrifaciens]|uniref:Lysine exporter LysO family protein n=1 Tax=Brenneria rubrifaciens TaxID=55213 RepID=A0A4P8R146_9GAMM|nr:lysine exporter LysO family protein [Brenneria rubrifaciens]QCR10335.1 lysine exporter LysO family protein [Brenneria rubrifaciens]